MKEYTYADFLNTLDDTGRRVTEAVHNHIVSHYRKYKPFKQTDSYLKIQAFYNPQKRFVKSLNFLLKPLLYVDKPLVFCYTLF